MTKLIQDCLTALYTPADNNSVRDRFNLVLYRIDPSFKIIRRGNLQFVIGRGPEQTFEELEDFKKILVIQTLLSRADGKAVMEFLDVVTFKWICNEPQKEATFKKIMSDDNKLARKWLMSLDHLLYREFTETLRTGKSLNEALKKINKIYIENI